MKSAVEYALEAFAKSKDPQHIDFILDRACYLEMKAVAKASGCRFLEQYATLLIDSINVKTFARIREMKGDWVAFNRVFLPGGSIPESLFVNGFDEDYMHFAEKLLPYHTFEEVMVKGGTQLSETGRFTELERLSDNAILEFAIGAKYIPYGLEVPAAYLIAKESEIRLVRIIIAALEQDLTADQLNARIRRTYV
jgi:V/A-type H+-transporting ATPase subunit C